MTLCEDWQNVDRSLCPPGYFSVDREGFNLCSSALVLCLLSLPHSYAELLAPGSPSYLPKSGREGQIADTLCRCSESLHLSSPYLSFPTSVSALGPPLLTLPTAPQQVPCVQKSVPLLILGNTGGYGITAVSGSYHSLISLISTPSLPSVLLTLKISCCS